MFGIGLLRQEVEEQHDKINESIEELKYRIPYQSETERELKRLEDENDKLHREKEKYASNLYSLQETNEKLLYYISQIEEVKQEGGIKVREVSYKDDLSFPPDCKYIRKEIPSLIIIQRVEGEK